MLRNSETTLMCMALIWTHLFLKHFSGLANILQYNVSLSGNSNYSALSDLKTSWCAALLAKPVCF